MQGNNPGQQNSGGNSPKQSGLSWAQPAGGGAAKPVENKPPQASTPAKAVQPAAKPAKTAVSTTASSSSRTFGLVAGGVVVAALLIWGVTSLVGTPAENGTLAEDGTATGEDATNDGASKVMQNLSSAGIGRSASANFSVVGQPAGNKVMVSLSKVSGPTWLVVYEMEGGVPMWVLGAGLVFPDSPQQVAIDLLRPTQAGETYLIAQTPDAGNDHVYTRGADVPLKDAEGKTLGLNFVAQ
jgi:hypothetical protein